VKPPEKLVKVAGLRMEVRIWYLLNTKHEC